MSDIFISYAHEDKSKAQLLAQGLETYGWTVFWDRNIPIGKTWQTYVGKALNEARCVVVMWTVSSIESQWVYEEADDGRLRNILIPILMDKIRPPIGFRSIQAADLSDWDGDPAIDSFRRLGNDIIAMLGLPSSVQKEIRVSESIKIEKEEQRLNKEKEAKEKAEKEKRQKEELLGRRKAEEEKKLKEKDERIKIVHESK